MTLAQLEQLVAALSSEERAVFGRTVGPEGAEQLLGALPEDKLRLLASAYSLQSDAAEAAATDDQLRAVYPHAMAVTNNLLSLEQLRAIVAGLTPEDLAGQSAFLGQAGRRALFSEMRPDRVAAILDHTPDWVFLETARQSHAQIERYTSTFYKQERIGGRLGDTETIALKVRESPKAMYLRWLAGPNKGREVLYNERVLGAGRLRVREAGLLGVVPVTLAVDSALARKGTNHLVTEIGLHNLLARMAGDFEKAGPRGHIRRVNHGIVDLDGVKLYKMESILPRDPSLGYYCHRMLHSMDYANAIEVAAEIYGFDNQLLERFEYRQVRINPPLFDADFDPRNPDYKLR
jgi:hypothetical protein